MSDTQCILELVTFADLDPEFKMCLLDLIPSIFSPSNLIPKVINGEKVKARDLLTYFKSYMDIFNSDKVPPVASIIEVMVKFIIYHINHKFR